MNCVINFSGDGLLPLPGRRLGITWMNVKLLPNVPQRTKCRVFCSGHKVPMMSIRRLDPVTPNGLSLNTVAESTYLLVYHYILVNCRCFAISQSNDHNNNGNGNDKGNEDDNDIDHYSNYKNGKSRISLRI